MGVWGGGVLCVSEEGDAVSKGRGRGGGRKKSLT